jgi:hypothetical protein
LSTDGIRDTTEKREICNNFNHVYWSAKTLQCQWVEEGKGGGGQRSGRGRLMQLSNCSELYPDSLKSQEKFLAFGGLGDSDGA